MEKRDSQAEGKEVAEAEELRTEAGTGEAAAEESAKKSSKKRGGWRNHLGNLLLLAGIVIIGIPFVGRYLADREQERMLKELYAQFEVGVEKEAEKLDQVLGYTDDETLQSDLDAAARAIAEIELSEGLNAENVTKLKTGPTAIGIIEIPKIALKYPIAEGVDDATLRFCIGHMPKTAELGQNGNSVLAGHRSHSFGDFFNRLDELGSSDTIIINTQAGATIYTVYEKIRVHKTDLSVLAQNKSKRELTLITCELGINPEERIIVKARAEAVEEPAQPAEKPAESSTEK